MSPIQQIFCGLGAVAKKIFVDDVFSTYLWAGNSTENTNINNGINLSGEGGMVLIKKRNASDDNLVYDTDRGHNERIKTNSDTDNAGLGQRLTGFNTNGFKLGNHTQVNASSNNYVSWSFRKAPGFFDIQQYSSGSSNTSGSIGNPNFQVNHDLGSIPGMILIKRTDSTRDWFAWVRGQEGVLNSSSPLSGASALPLANVTSTYFKFTAGNGSYNDPGNFISYIFGGGESDAATARSLDFTPNAHLTVGDHADYRPGTGDFTLEAWIKPDAWGSGAGFWHTINGLTISKTSGGNLGICTNATSTLTASHDPIIGQWTHVAVCRSGSTIRMFYNGTQVASGSNSVNYGGTGTLTSGHTNYFDGKISNLRMVKGTALYTTSFVPPYEPLTNVTNTKLLICNNSDPTAGTVLPTTINNSGAVASIDSPFDDPAGFVFGESGSENVIKTGSYIGGGSTYNEIYVGFEPQWILLKNADTNSTGWILFDSMRGITDDAGDDKILYANASSNEASLGANAMSLTSTGFKPVNSSDNYNESNKNMIYIAIRRPDGYCGKPVEDATDATKVFAMDTGSGNSTLPVFDSGFPVDLALYTNVTTTDNNFIASRLTGTDELRANATNAASTNNGAVWDSNAGWCTNGFNSNSQAWMWKRHAGFDVVTYTGNGVANAGHEIRHSLSKVPEMIWVKAREDSQNWRVYHKGLNGGTNPEQYSIRLNWDSAEQDTDSIWYDTAPTSTAFTVGNDGNTNSADKGYLAMLFSSVSGISKVGSYTGTGSIASGQNNPQTTGFSPRFLMFKRADGTGDWYVFDTLRGLSSAGVPAGYDPYLLLNDSAAQGGTTNNPLGVTSTGFWFHSSNATATINIDGADFIYYAHA